MTWSRPFALIPLVIATAGPAAGADAMRLTRAVVPTFEAVQLTLDAAKTDYSGSVRVELQVNEPAASFRLHAEEMRLGHIRLSTADGRAIDVTTESGEKGLLTIKPAQPLAPGRHLLEIEFENEFDTRP